MGYTQVTVRFRGTSVYVTHKLLCTLQRHISMCYTQVTVCFTEARLHMLHTGDCALYRGTSAHVTHR